MKNPIVELEQWFDAAVQADHGVRLHLPAGFLQRLAPAGVEQALAVFEVAGGLIQHQPAVGRFLHQQETAVAFDDGGNGDAGCPDHGRNSSNGCFVARR